MPQQTLIGLVLLALALGVPAGAGTGELPKVALFELVLVDSSLEGELGGADAREAARLELLDRELRQRLARSGRLEVLLAGAKTGLGCRACELETASTLGADYALSGWVQKVSDLILNINLRVAAVETGRTVFQDSVDIRGNTDESWLRGLRYLVERHLLAPPD